MNKLIRLDIVQLDYYEHKKYYHTGTKTVLVRLDAIAEIWPPETFNLVTRGFEHQMGAMDVASIYTMNVHGQGINGVSTHKYITKASYEKLLKTLNDYICVD